MPVKKFEVLHAFHAWLLIKCMYAICRFEISIKINKNKINNQINSDSYFSTIIYSIVGILEKQNKSRIYLLMIIMLDYGMYTVE